MLALAAAGVVGACATMAVSDSPDEASYTSWTLAAAGSGDAPPARCVVLLHGLARTSRSMRPLAEAVAASGAAAVGVDYPSRAFTVEALADRTVGLGLDACRDAGAGRIDFVTHSMGAILLRQAFEAGPPRDLGRVVMLAPPNRGSEVVDRLRDVPGFAMFNGPAGLQLGTDAAGVLARLGPTRADVAVIAGTRSINVLLSQALPNPDDGKVSAARTRLDGMCAWLAVPATHPMIMRKASVIDETLAFLETGRLLSPRAEYPDCPARGGTPS